MSHDKPRSFNSFHLPQLKPNHPQSFNQSHLHSQNKNILSRYQSHLKTIDKKYQSETRENRRLKTIDVDNNQIFYDFRKQLKFIKEQVRLKTKEYNLKLENKLEEIVFLSAFKKQQPQIVIQPFPMYLPPMYPPYPMMHPSSNDDEYPQYPSYPYPNYLPSKAKRLKKLKPISELVLKKFRKYAYAVLFTIRLRKFVRKVINHRKEMFQKYLKETNEFKKEASQIKVIFIDGIRAFLSALLQRQESQLKLNEGDSENFKKEKVQNTRKLIDLLIECLYKTIQSEKFNQIIRSVYYFCKHGSFACSQELLTVEQLQNMSISEKNFYLQADKNMEKSQIINFLLMKILIYNVLGQIWKIDSAKFSKEKETLQQNVHLLSSIFYELLMDVQDDFIVNTPKCYQINNYLQLRGNKIFPAESLTVKPGEYRKNEVISGFLNENYLKNMYKLEKTWTKEKNMLIEIIEKIHNQIVNYHKKLIKQFL